MIAEPEALRRWTCDRTRSFNIPLPLLLWGFTFMLFRRLPLTWNGVSSQTLAVDWGQNTAVVSESWAFALSSLSLFSFSFSLSFSHSFFLSLSLFLFTFSQIHAFLTLYNYLLVVRQQTWGKANYSSTSSILSVFLFCLTFSTPVQGSAFSLSFLMIYLWQKKIKSKTRKQGQKDHFHDHSMTKVVKGVWNGEMEVVS